MSYSADNLTRDQALRLEALNKACDLAREWSYNASDIVQAAELYYAFLTDEGDD